MTRKLLHRIWRFAAMTLPLRLRDELPGYPWLAVFVEQFIGCSPQARVQIATLLVDPAGRYRKAINRAGGPRAAFWLVIGDNPIPEHWKTLEEPHPTVDTVVNVLIAICGTQGVRLEERAAK
jgi:hypothetical protein